MFHFYLDFFVVVVQTSYELLFLKELFYLEDFLPFCTWLLSVLWFFVLHNTASCFRIWNLTHSLLFSEQFLGGRSFSGAADPFTNCWSDCEQLTDKRCVRCRLDWQATGCAGFLGLLRDTHLLTVPFRSLWTSEASQWVFTRRAGESRGVTEILHPSYPTSFTAEAHTPISPSTGVATGMQGTSKA